MKDPFWNSAVVRTAIIAVIGVLSMGAAAIVRQQGDDIADLKTEKAVRTEVDRQILSDLHAIKKHLGIPQ